MHFDITGDVYEIKHSEVTNILTSNVILVVMRTVEIFREELILSLLYEQEIN